MWEFIKRLLGYKIRGFEAVKGAPWDTKLPVKGSDDAAGYDFYAPRDIVLKSGERSENIFLNIKAYMQHGEYLEMKIRSGLAVKSQVMLETSGIIDKDYYSNETNDGNISVVFRNNNRDLNAPPVVIKKGDRCCQGIFYNHLTADTDSSLGQRRGGFGSTGKH